ncbi:MAG: replication protein [Burkholderiaceae bacterium]|nr:MAG: replication protein [Burkholderiaceae bacterium]
MSLMSETATSEAQMPMGLDTVRLKTPRMARSIVDRIKAQGESYCRVRNDTGELVWEVTRTNLLGSFDSRIMVKPMYEDCIKSKHGKPEWHPCPPYLVIECSVPKAFNGQNVYGAIEDFQGACERLKTLLQLLLGTPLPPVENWTVQRVDWAENFRLPYLAVQEFFEAIYHISFPRRKMQKYSNESIFTPGSTTTIKLYHKGPEFDKNDRKRLYVVLRSQYQQNKPKDAPTDWAHRKASRRVAALHRLANSRLRAEVEIHAEKLDYDFGHKPKVREITAEYLKSVFDKEISRLLREGQGAIQIVRTSLAVRDRLEAHYTAELAGLLHGFWFALTTHGEDDTRKRFTRPTFYRRRKQLVDIGVSWLVTDIQLIERQGQKLPADFSPVRADPRRCESLVRERPAFSYERGLLQLAA